MSDARSRTRRPKGRRLRSVLTVALMAAVLVAGLYVYLDRQFRLAVMSGDGPHLVASDRSALRSLLVESAELADLRAAGRVFSVPPSSRCRVVRSDNRSPCRVPQDFPVQVELLEGPRRGKLVWLCFGDIRWPLHAPP